MQLAVNDGDYVGAVFNEDVRAHLFERMKKIVRHLDHRRPLVRKLESESSSRPLSSDEERECFRFARDQDAFYAHRERILAPRAPNIPKAWHLESTQKLAYRSLRGAMDAYFEHAFHRGMFDRNENLLGRLRSLDADQYWQAYAECVAAFAIEAQLGVKLEPCEETAEGTVPDFRTEIDGQNYFVEVKAPVINSPTGICYRINHHERISRSLRKASSQIPRDSSGVVVVCPKTRGFPVERHAFVRALYGCRAAQFRLHPDTHEISTSWGFEANGSFLKPSYVPDKGFQSAKPHVSAVVAMYEECWLHKNCHLPVTRHRLAVYENPGAHKSFPSAVFEPHPILKFDKSSIYWSDGQNIV